MEDISIVDLYLARDERAIRETDGKYGKKLYSISHRITENDADTEECVSATYLGAWTRIPPHEPRTYLCGRSARRMSKNSQKNSRNVSPRRTTSPAASTTARLRMR